MALFIAVVWGAQVYFVVRAYDDPHVHFGYQPFNESSIWRGEIWRVFPDGRRVSIREGWEGYHWDVLVRDRVRNPWNFRRADSGVGSTLAFVQEALHWVSRHTPNDCETEYLEARIEYVHNRREPQFQVFRSAPRELAPECDL